MKNVGLVLEGGGMRAPYTSAILDYFLEKKLYIPYTIGASAGAVNAAAYVSRQEGWGKAAIFELVTNPNLKTIKNLFRGRTYADIDLLFTDFVNHHPFDEQSYMENDQECVIVAFNCRTGQSFFAGKHDGIDAMTLCRASCSLPFITPMVYLNGDPYLDGGMNDSMPIQKSMEDGNTKNILILTKSADFVRKPDRSAMFAPLFYRKYPAIHNMIKNRHIKYNADMAFAQEEQKKGNVFIIRPSRPHGVGRMTTDINLIRGIYDLGREDAAAIYPQLLAWLGESAEADGDKTGCASAPIKQK